MRKLVAFLLIVFTLTMFFLLPVSAQAPSSAWDTGYYDLWVVNSMYWDTPGNVAETGNLNSYYQWFYTDLPFYANSFYSIPFLIYTYDGSMIDGGNPTTRYAIRLSQDSSRNVYVEYVRLNSSNVVSVVKTVTYCYNVDYDELVTFSGWGMDNSGNLYVLIHIDDSSESRYDYVKLGSSPNGDTHLYAAPNNFDNFYIMGFNTVGFKSLSISQSNVVWCYEYLKGQVTNSTIYRNWFTYLHNHTLDADPERTAHYFQLNVAAPAVSLGDKNWNNLLNPSAPVSPGIGGDSGLIDVVYNQVASGVATVRDQYEVAGDDGRCYYNFYVTQHIQQFKGQTDLEITYSVQLSSINEYGVYGYDYLSYSKSFRSSSLFDRLSGVSLRPDTCSYPMQLDREQSYNAVNDGDLMYERWEYVQIDLVYEQFKSSRFNVYLVTDGSGWVTYQDKADYLETLQQAYLNKYQEYFYSFFNELEGLSIEMGDIGSVMDPLWDIPGWLTLVISVATLTTVKAVLF